MTQARAIGRPRKTAEERRDEQLPPVRLTVAERAFIEAQAMRAGLSVSDYARRRLLGHMVSAARTRSDDRAILELNRVGVLLNQVARALHTDRPERVELGDVLDELRAVLVKVAADGP